MGKLIPGWLESPRPDRPGCRRGRSWSYEKSGCGLPAPQHWIAIWNLPWPRSVRILLEVDAAEGGLDAELGQLFGQVIGGGRPVGEFGRRDQFQLDRLARLILPNCCRHRGSSRYRSAVLRPWLGRAGTG